MVTVSNLVEHVPALAMEARLPTEPAPTEPTVSAPRAPSRPQNYARSLFHVGCAVGVLALLRFLPSRGWLIGVAVAGFTAAWTMEIARRRSGAANDRIMAVFAPIAHPHEHHGINSATWYTTALLLLAIFAPIRAAEVGVLVLGVADPAAGLIGRRFGRTRLRANRSLEGSIGFVVVGVLAAGAWLAVVYGLALPALLTLALVGGLVGALTELASTRFDDNFTIPVTVALAVWIAQALVLA